MIDLSSQPKDGDTTVDAGQAARHDAVPDQATLPGKGWSRRTAYDRAEMLVQRFSRWAGPVTLIVALGVIGWLLLR